MAVDPVDPVDPKPHPHATAEEVQAAYGDPKLANVLYHDWEAGTYDEKWSISYDERCITYATDRFRAAAGDVGPYGHALELGSGTGFFLLNLMQGGVVERGSVTDLSPGMVEVALRNAEQLGLPVDGRVADAERIPYDDDTFDLVVGHAVLHHIPDVELSLREVVRVLKPGGRFVFAGPIEQFGFGAFIEGLTTHHTMAVLAHGPLYLEATREDYENLVKDAGFASCDVAVRQLTLHLPSLEPVLQTGWEMCELSELPQDTQDKIRETTIQRAEPYRTENGYAFPDQIVVGQAMK